MHLDYKCTRQPCCNSRQQSQHQSNAFRRVHPQYTHSRRGCRPLQNHIRHIFLSLPTVTLILLALQVLVSRFLLLHHLHFNHLRDIKDHRHLSYNNISSNISCLLPQLPNNVLSILQVRLPMSFLLLLLFNSIINNNSISSSNIKAQRLLLLLLLLLLSSLITLH